MPTNFEDCFKKLYVAKDEEEVTDVINLFPEIFSKENWKPLGANYSNYGVVKNQQSNPIAALIEKITNSIDAILMRRCLEMGINPSSEHAPKSMEDAIDVFFPNHNWDLQTFRRKQAEEIQIIADGKGPKSSKNFPTSVIIFDNGEGQQPAQFENTFLSLLRGNKNDIHFVQGKYNMGGSGAIVFCGRKRYHLIASKRFDGGEFGFTLIREHQRVESDHSKETWYEYLIVDNKIPSFQITELDLGLENRKFTSGTIMKLYSYQFPKGYSAFSQDLNQSINEFLYSPALPILTKDTAERYPNNKVLITDLYGLRRRLLREEDDYLDDKFSIDCTDEWFGAMKVSCFVFKTKVKEYDLKTTKENIQKRYFGNGMSVLFSLNGQVHGYYSPEFITRSLKMNLLKNHLLIHVDCTYMNYEFRKELFMASRDRLKDGEETQYLRSYLATKLSEKDGRLSAIEKRRKQAVEIDTSSNTQDLLRNLTKDMPLSSELMKLLGQAFKLEIKKEEKKQNGVEKPDRAVNSEEAFNPKRFPSLFKLKVKNDGKTEVAKIPLNGEKSIAFSTDVENDYFDRIDEPGELKLAVLSVNSNETDGGTDAGIPKEISEIFNVNKSSPNNGKIKVSFNPKDTLSVGDYVQIKASLAGPDADLEEIFWVKIVDDSQVKKEAPKKQDENEPLGLPPLIFAFKVKPVDHNGAVAWDDVEEATSLSMDFDVPMVPEAEGDNLTRIFINMESKVLMDYKGKNKNINTQQIEIINRKYFTSVYFHTLFLYTITKNRGFEINKKRQEKDDFEPVDIGSYLKDIFSNYYSTFLLNFGGMAELMESISE